MLSFDDSALLQTLLSLLTIQATDADASAQIRSFGGIPLVVSLLRDTMPSSKAPANDMPCTRLCDSLESTLTSEREQTAHSSIDYRCVNLLCCLITQLAADSENAVQIRQANGVYSLGLVLFSAAQPRPQGELMLAEQQQLAAAVFRGLRFLFSVERNRRVFKRLFPPVLFNRFIDVGHYAYELRLYEPLVAMHESLSTAEKKAIIAG